MYEYDDNFYTYINEGAAESARQILPLLLEVLPGPVESVLDVGCGAGAWLSVWKSLGARVLGLDGDYINTRQLLIELGEFKAADLREGFALDRQFGLVQSLEVAEHLPQASAGKFVENLCQHSLLVLFSAATPGQGGENHINEQSYEYWRKLFRDQGYSMFDPVRRGVAGRRTVKPWYRYNTFLYASDHCDRAVLDALSPFRIEPNELAEDLAPLAYRLRKQLVRLLPGRVSTVLAVVKKTLFRLSLKLRRQWVR